MLSRLFSTSSRISLTTTFRFFQFSARNTARFGRNNGGGFKMFDKAELGLRSGPTFKERLLGPTTGKPFLYGTIALIGASTVGIGAVVFYGLSSKEGTILEQCAHWSNTVRQNISNSYQYLIGSLSITAASAYAASHCPPLLRFAMKMNLANFLGTLAVFYGITSMCRSIDYDDTFKKHSAWLLQCGFVGVISSPLCLVGGPVLMRAAWYTAAIVAGLSLIATTAPSEKFLKWSGPLTIGLAVVIASNVAWFVFPTSSAIGASLASIVIYGGLILFSVLLIYNTQLIAKKAVEHEKNSVKMNGMTPSFDPINAQMGIYLDIINIFDSIVYLMYGSNKSKGEKRSGRFKRR